MLLLLFFFWLFFCGVFFVAFVLLLFCFAFCLFVCFESKIFGHWFRYLFVFICFINGFQCVLLSPLSVCLSVCLSHDTSTHKPQTNTHNYSHTKQQQQQQKQNNKIQTRMTNVILKKKKSKHIKRFKRTLFIRTKHNIRIFGVIPFIKLQNDS